MHCVNIAVYSTVQCSVMCVNIVVYSTVQWDALCYIMTVYIISGRHTSTVPHQSTNQSDM